jgi:CarD family transcriptional regulator
MGSKNLMASVKSAITSEVPSLPKKRRGLMTAQFKVGDHAVYPGHGVGKINSIESKEILGTIHTFYSVLILETGMKIMIPAANIKSVGLRPLISKEEAQKVVGILKDKNVKIDTQTWNRRFKTRSVFEIAEVLRDLYVLKVDKELSFGEKKMLDTAKNLLLKELNLAPDVKDLVSSDTEIKAIFDVQ